MRPSLQGSWRRRRHQRPEIQCDQLEGEFCPFACPPQISPAGAAGSLATSALQEPEKAALLKHGRDSSVVPARLALCILQVPGKGAVYVAIVQLHAGAPAKVLAWDQVSHAGSLESKPVM